MSITIAARSAGISLALAGAVGFAWAGCNRNSSAVDTVSNADSGSSSPDERIERYEIDLFAFGRQLGTIAPCGCTTEPLGGLQYAFGYIEAQSQAGHRLILEPGSFLFPDPDGPEAPTDEAAWAQAKQRAELLVKQFGSLDGLVSGLGPIDYAYPGEAGAALTQLPLPRVIANMDDAARPAGVASHRQVLLGRGLTAAVTQIVDPQLAEAARARDWGASFPAVTEPIAALERLWPQLEGASLQIVMVNGPRSLGEAVARELEGVDVVVIGETFTNAEQSRLGSAPVQIGTAWVLEPGDRAQTISHLTLSLHPSELPDAPAGVEGPLSATWTLIPSKAQRQAELARLDEKLAKFAKDPTADQGFIARLQAERDEIAATLEKDGMIPDDVELAVIPQQVKVTCHLAADAAAKSALDGYDATVAEVNRQRFTGVHAPEPARGQPGYVGIEACGDCHEEAVAMWKTTVHVRAYETLVAVNKQFDLSCVSCHVTGFRQPGGSEVVENQGLQAVQCEQCHGPGSVHVEDPSDTNIRLEAPVSVCLTCHTPEHSDTFDYQAYLRDVLGEGHGAETRAALPPGPSGRELRAAGLARAGGGCKKM